MRKVIIITTHNNYTMDTRDAVMLEEEESKLSVKAMNPPELIIY